MYRTAKEAELVKKGKKLIYPSNMCTAGRAEAVTSASSIRKCERVF